MILGCLAALAFGGPSVGLAGQASRARERASAHHRRRARQTARKAARRPRKRAPKRAVRTPSGSRVPAGSPKPAAAPLASGAESLAQTPPGPGLPDPSGGGAPAEAPSESPAQTGGEEPPQPPAGPAGRKLIWSDEFTGAAGSPPNPANWSFDTGGGGWGNEELEYYTSRTPNAALNGEGQLMLTARAEKYTGPDGVTRDYTSARLQTLNTFQFQYGVAEARIKVPAGQGLLAAFWALGSEAYEGSQAWPGCGEIDAMEVLGSEPNVVDGTLHGPWPSAPNGVGGEAQSTTPLSAGFHVYGVEWEPERISFLLDGSVYQTITPANLPPGAPWPFAHPFFLLLDLSVGGSWPGPPDASTPFPARMLVDWVRVWQ